MIRSAFLEVLDPRKNRRLSIDTSKEVDLSHFIFMPGEHMVPCAARRSLEVTSPATRIGKLEIATRYLVPTAEENGSRRAVSDRCGCNRSIIEDYTRESGVRELESNRPGCPSVAALLARSRGRDHVEAEMVQSIPARPAMCGKRDSPSATRRVTACGPGSAANSSTSRHCGSGQGNILPRKDWRRHEGSTRPPRLVRAGERAGIDPVHSRNRISTPVPAARCRRTDPTPELHVHASRRFSDRPVRPSGDDGESVCASRAANRRLKKSRSRRFEPGRDDHHPKTEREDLSRYSRGKAKSKSRRGDRRMTCSQRRWRKRFGSAEARRKGERVDPTAW